MATKLTGEQIEEVKQQAMDHFWPHARPAGDMSEDSGIKLVQSAKGCWVEDVEGEQWFDTLSSMWLKNIGHGRKEIADAVYERYAFGRLFGCTRLDFCGLARRLYYTAFAPALPVLLIGRMGAKAVRERASAVAFFSALPALTAMVLAWSWGEWMGYLTRKRPRSLVVAPEIRATRRSASPS